MDRRDRIGIVGARSADRTGVQRSKSLAQLFRLACSDDISALLRFRIMTSKAAIVAIMSFRRAARPAIARPGVGRNPIYVNDRRRPTMDSPLGCVTQHIGASFDRDAPRRVAAKSDLQM